MDTPAAGRSSVNPAPVSPLAAPAPAPESASTPRSPEPRAGGAPFDGHSAPPTVPDSVSQRAHTSPASSSPGDSPDTLNPDGSTPPAGDLSALQSRLVAALAAVKGQQSASELIEDATLSVDGETLRIQTTVSKTMLPVAINAEAQRLLQATLRDGSLAQGTASPLKLQLLPGAAVPSNAPRKPRSSTPGSSTPGSSTPGSAAELAEQHPMVQQAKRIFSADISNVIDLREKESGRKN